MLLKITAFHDLDARKLMDVYAESNADNTAYFCPGETDLASAVKKVEEGFLEYLKNDFFRRDEAVYWVLEEDGVWVSALRTCRVGRELYYLEALETRPDRRMKGCAANLLSGVLADMKQHGAFRLCDCVGKRNAASLKTHETCGFRIVSQDGFDYLQNETNPRCFGLEYRCPPVHSTVERGDAR
ncbi:MAG: GNAT family N-acetyltransferase [Clostridia bacterium]|nr:GNAT family N-acetyltransferase [Clostridia bacterium]